MKTCPKCNEINGDSNNVCFGCGANLPETKSTETQTATKIPDNTNVSNVGLRKNSEKISSMATTVCVIGIILGVVLGFIFKTATIGDSLGGSYLDYELEYSFNWVLCISTVIGTICFTVILAAMSYIARAIEEK